MTRTDWSKVEVRHVDLDHDLAILWFPEPVPREVRWEGRNLAKQVIDVIADPTAASDEYASLLYRIVGPEAWGEAERVAILAKQLARK